MARGHPPPHCENTQVLREAMMMVCPRRAGLIGGSEVIKEQNWGGGGVTMMICCCSGGSYLQPLHLQKYNRPPAGP